MSGGDWLYSDKVQFHFMNPKNILTVSEEEYQANGVGMVGSAACGDMMKVFIKVENNKIIDLKWKTYGCASAIASTSALSELVVKDGGMSLEQAYKLTPEDIIQDLGGLPSNKIHCSVLGDKALRVAINDYFERRGEENPFGSTKSRVICDCKFKTEEDIKMEVLEGATDFETVAKRTEIGSVCGKCCKKASNLVEELSDKYYKDEVYNPKEEK